MGGIALGHRVAFGCHSLIDLLLGDGCGRGFLQKAITRKVALRVGCLRGRATFAGTRLIELCFRLRFLRAHLVELGLRVRRIDIDKGLPLRTNWLSLT